MDDSAEDAASRRGFIKGLAAAAGGVVGLLSGGGEAQAQVREDLRALGSGTDYMKPHYTYGQDYGHPVKKMVPGGTKKFGLPETVYMPTPPKEAPKDKSDYKVFDISVELTTHEFLPGVKTHTLAFNSQVPGPEIRVDEGDWVWVNFKNNTELLHTIHWHGLMVPENMDGVPYITQPPTMPNQTFVYRFRAIPYGTRFYHCHFGTPLHQLSAMHGPLIIESDNEPIKKAFPYAREYTLILSQYDTKMFQADLNRMVKRMRERIVLMRRGRITDRVLARFNSVKDFLAAIKDGYIPPYKQARNAPPELPNYNIYSINGKSYPMTPKLYIKQGELIRVRMINAGNVEHYMHLHGHDFWEVAVDGAPLPNAIRQNTLRVSPGKTHDIIIEGANPGVWTFHDHATFRATNNGKYPGGVLTTLNYEDFTPEYSPHVALDE